MTLYKNVDGVNVPLSPEEVIEYEEMEAQWAAGEPGREYESFIAQLTAFLDLVAAQRQYSSAITCATYVSSTNMLWQQEALVFVAWRDDFLQAAYIYQTEVQQGEIPNPSFDNFLTQAPTITWPVV
jgi:hypothetical protein